jgi:hypothetical protein
MLSFVEVRYSKAHCTTAPFVSVSKKCIEAVVAPMVGLAVSGVRLSVLCCCVCDENVMSCCEDVFGFYVFIMKCIHFLLPM